MTANEALAVVRRFYSELWNDGELALIPVLLDPNVTFRGSLGSIRTGHEEVADYVKSLRDALGDYRCIIVDAVAAEDHVATRMIFRGVHQAPFLDFTPTGREVSWDGAAFFTFGDGLITDVWVLGDLRSLVAQLTEA
jgi:steroid delta-isomerase-like uncharacterized protein